MMRLSIWAAYASVLVVGVTAIQLDQVSPPVSIDTLQDYIVQRIGDPEHSLPTVAEALQAVQSAPSLSNDLCQSATQALESIQLEEIAAAIVITARSGCGNKIAAGKALASMWALLPDHATIKDHAQLLQASRVLHEAKLAKVQYSDELVQSLSRVITEVVAPSGRARMQSGAPVSIYATGLAYQVVADIRALRMKLTSEAENAVANLLQQAPKVLEQASQKGLQAVGDSNGLAAASLVLQGLVAVPIEADPVKIAQLASYVSHFGTVGSLEEASQLLLAKNALISLKAPTIWFDLSTPFLSSKGKEAVVVLVKDESGSQAEISSSKANVRSSNGERVMEDILLKGSGGRYTLDLQPFAKKGGRYIVELEASVGGIKVEGHVVVAVMSPSTFSSVTASMELESSAEPEEVTVKFPGQFKSPLTAGLASTLKVSFEAESASAPILKLLCKSSGEAVVFAVKKAASSMVRISMSNAISQMDSQCQELALSIAVGDEASDGQEWRLGDILVPGEPLPADVWSPFAPKPTIVHQFRVPDKRPPRVVSIIFACAALAPLALLLVALFKTGANIKGFPLQGSHAVSAGVFHSGLLGLVLLYSAFWLRLNLLQTLPPLAVLILIVAMSGYFLLSKQSALRLKSV